MVHHLPPHVADIRALLRAYARVEDERPPRYEKFREVWEGCAFGAVVTAVPRVFEAGEWVQLLMQGALAVFRMDADVISRAGACFLLATLWAVAGVPVRVPLGGIERVLAAAEDVGGDTARIAGGMFSKGAFMIVAGGLCGPAWAPRVLGGAHPARRRWRPSGFYGFVVDKGAATAILDNIETEELEGRLEGRPEVQPEGVAQGVADSNGMG